jgi:cyclopropane-fatty-acyl-phospholipid synthase
MWEQLLLRLLRRGLKVGRLHLTLPDGTAHVFGPGGAPQVAVRLSGRDTVRRLVLAPELALGETYMDEQLTIDGDDLQAMLTLAMRNLRQGRGGAARGLRLGMRARSWWRRNRPQTARANVAHHYDIGPDLYDLFLDAHKQYTCAYFRRPEDDLETAQLAKMDHIARKLILTPGQRVLDIGSGFGTLAIRLAQTRGVHVTGVTLSEVQLAEARRRAAEAGVADLVSFELRDYRDVVGPFDRVVSVGMMEHVGRAELATYFARLRGLLAPDGLALVHYIGRFSPPDAISPWFDKYIFPGAYCPSLSVVTPVIEKTGLILTDIEVLQGHYERTIQHWIRRFEANADRARALFDDRFVRMWRFYLNSAERGFAEGEMVVHQLQLAAGREVVPLTRGYVYQGNEAA